MKLDIRPWRILHRLAPPALLAALCLGLGASPSSAQTASVTFRNAGTNPASYDALSLPILGSAYVGTIDLAGTTGHNLTALVGYSTSMTFTLTGGQTLLVNIADSNGELLTQPAMGGPIATYIIPIPADITLAGFAAFTQAVHIGGIQPFALSNAQDLVLGYPFEMALIPAGEYEMGDHHDGMTNAVPVHAVYIDAFWMDVYQVTNEKYCTYLNDAYGQGLIEVIGGIVTKYGDTERYLDTSTYDVDSRIHWSGAVFSVEPTKEDHPVLEVSWHGGAAYANWRSAQDGLQPCYDMDASWACDYAAGGYRLPTEAEWEKAARGGEHGPYYRYPWGDSIVGSNANYWASGDPYEGIWPETTPVGHYDGGQTPPGPDMANGYGLYDLAGNLLEWCNDWYDANYYTSSPYDNPTGPISGSLKVLRGGGWVYIQANHRTAYRDKGGNTLRGHNAGFRLVSSAF